MKRHLVLTFAVLAVAAAACGDEAAKPDSSKSSNPAATAAKTGATATAPATAASSAEPKKDDSGW